MSYASLETSQSSAQPVELFRFDYGLETYYYTSADKDFTYQGRLYTATPVSRSQVDQSQEDQAGSLEVSLPRENPVSALFIDYLPIIPVSVTIYRLHRGDSGVVSVFQGKVTSATYTDNECKLRCAANADVLNRIIPIAVYQPQCNHTVFSQSQTYDMAGGNRAQTIGCNASREAYRFAVAVQGVSGLTLTASPLASKPDDWFTYGYVERSNGEVRWITEHTGATLTLSYPFKGLNPGETVSVFPGCDGLESTCRNKFNNVLNFSGFTRLPSKNPFSSSIQ